MKFMTTYFEAIKGIQAKLSDLTTQNEADQQKMDKLQEDYEVHIASGDFDKATATKREIKEVEIEIETRADIISVLEDPKSNPKQAAVIGAAKDYMKLRGEYGKRSKKLTDKANQLQNEYLDLLAEIHSFNLSVRNSSNKFNQIKSIVDWNDPEVLKSLDIHSAHQMTSGNVEIPIHEYLVNNYNKFTSRVIPVTD